MNKPIFHLHVGDIVPITFPAEDGKEMSFLGKIEYISPKTTHNCIISLNIEVNLQFFQSTADILTEDLTNPD